jgi:hypothetical protein
VARSFCRRMIQPIKDRVHPAYDYGGSLTPLAKSTARSPRRGWQLEFPKCMLGK